MQRWPRGTPRRLLPVYQSHSNQSGSTCNRSRSLLMMTLHQLSVQSKEKFLSVCLVWRRQRVLQTSIQSSHCQSTEARLGIPLPLVTRNTATKASLDGKATLINTLKQGVTLPTSSVRVRVRSRSKRGKVALEEITLEGLLYIQTALARNHLFCAQEAGGWLTTMPNQLNGMELSVEEFHNSL